VHFHSVFSPSHFPHQCVSPYSIPGGFGLKSLAVAFQFLPTRLMFSFLRDRSCFPMPPLVSFVVCRYLMSVVFCFPAFSPEYFPGCLAFSDFGPSYGRLFSVKNSLWPSDGLSPTGELRPVLICAFLRSFTPVHLLPFQALFPKFS